MTDRYMVRGLLAMLMARSSRAISDKASVMDLPLRRTRTVNGLRALMWMIVAMAVFKRKTVTAMLLLRGPTSVASGRKIE